MNTSEKLKLARQERKQAQRELKEFHQIEIEKELAHKARVALVWHNKTAEERKALIDRWERVFDSKYELAH
jgi:hypothetical protein